MLTIKYKNANITFNNHTDLLINRDELEKLFNRLDVLFDKVTLRYNNLNIVNDSIVFVRLRQTDNLSVYIGV